MEHVNVSLYRCSLHSNGSHWDQSEVPILFRFCCNANESSDLTSNSIGLEFKFLNPSHQDVHQFGFIPMLPDWLFDPSVQHETAIPNRVAQLIKPS
jgi:hypothetical protein